MNARGLDRRHFLGTSALAAGAAILGRGRRAEAAAEAAAMSGPVPPRQFHLGMVTYNMAKDMDLPTLIKTCEEANLEGVELRTTHKHGVEPSLSAAERKEVRKRFEDSDVVLWGLGTTCEFHSPDPAEVKRQIKICGDFCQLAEDVGAAGVKVRPNGLPDKVPVEKTLEQIGKALIECGKLADDHGVEIFVEVHGRGTAHPPYMRTIMDHCGHPKVGVCWNSNDGDVKDGSVEEYFMLLRPFLKSCHITELWKVDYNYPYDELFTLMRRTRYDRFTLAEIQGNNDPVRFMRYYRALWNALSS
jgi:hypothetical protein